MAGSLPLCRRRPSRNGCERAVLAAASHDDVVAHTSEAPQSLLRPEGYDSRPIGGLPSAGAMSTRVARAAGQGCHSVGQYLRWP